MNTHTTDVCDWFMDCGFSVRNVTPCKILNTNPVTVMSDPISSMSATWEIHIWFRYVIHITSNLQHQVYSIAQKRTQMQPLNQIHTPTRVFPLVRVKLNFTFQLISLWILCNAKATIARFRTKKKTKQTNWIHCDFIMVSTSVLWITPRF